jgi:AcrR family transcriptional regulator
MDDRRSDDRGGEGNDPGWPLLDAGAFARRFETAVAADPDQRAEALRRAMERAALELSGEIGYRRMTVRGLLAASDSHRDRFYAAYADKAECYAVGYAAAIEELAARLLGACAEESDWPAAVRAALVSLDEFVAAEPTLAKGLLAEVHVAGGAALAKRKEVFERLSRAIDRARRETDPSRHSPPPVTSDFILSAIEAAALRSLAADEADQFAHQVPGLLLLAIGPYFGHDVAWAEIRRLG